MGARAGSAQSHGGAAANRGDGKADRESTSDENKCGAAPERIEMIATDSQLAELLPQLERVDRIAVDTEADSLHCYYEKLCLVQLSLGGHDYLIDPLAGFDLAPLANTLTDK